MPARFLGNVVASVVLLLAPLQGDCDPRAGSSALRIGTTPMAARLISGGPAVEIVSPIGVASTLCSLSPVMSEGARRQIVTVTDIDCRGFSDYSPTAVWLQSGGVIDPWVLRSLSRRAEVFRGPPPFNDAISNWTRRQGGLPIHIAQPVRFAAVSALVYATTWDYAIPRSLSRRRIFHGRDRSSTVTFIEGLGATVQREGSCERTNIALEFGGSLLLSKVIRGDIVAGFRCLAEALPHSQFIGARFALPRIAAHGQSDLSQRLKAAGVTDIFSPARRPFQRLQPTLALDSVLQGIELRIDESGVGVRATTAADTFLGHPHAKIHVTFDVPFVFELLDGHHMPAALGVINDL